MSERVEAYIFHVACCATFGYWQQSWEAFVFMWTFLTVIRGMLRR